MAQRFVQTQAVALYTGLSASATSMIITPYPTDIQTGAKLVYADFGATPTVTVDPKVPGYEEIISFTGITDNGDGTATLTGLTRNLIGQYPYSTAGTGKQHGSSAVVVFSDNPQVYNRLASKENDETITGSWSFPTPTIASNPATKSYVDNSVAAGASDMSTTSVGIGRISVSPNVTLGNPTITIASPAVITLNSHGLTVNDSVQFTTSGALPTGISPSTNYYVISAGLTSNAFEISATRGGSAINTSGSQNGTHTLILTTPVAVGNQDTRLPTAGQAAALPGNNTDIAVGSGNKYVTQTGLQKQAENYVLTTGSANAYVATLSPVPTSYANGMPIRLKANFTNTGAATVNVNSLGAKTIKKNGTVDLAAGDIQSGQLFEVAYDGTYLQLLSPVFNLPFPAQDIGLATGTGVPGNSFFCASLDGSVAYFAYDAGGTTATIHRLLKDLRTGNYYITHTTTLSIDSARLNGIACTSTFLYVFGGISATGVARRYSLADLSGVTSMTITSPNGANLDYGMWSDGTDVYMINTAGVADVYRRYTISGTTMTNAGTVTYTSAGIVTSAFSDGTSVWMVVAAGGAMTLSKYALAGGAATSTSTLTIFLAWNASNTFDIFNGGFGVMGIGIAYNFVSAAAVVGTAIHISAISNQ